MHYVKKICLLGDFSVGKTSLVRRFTENRFDDRYLSTLGVKVSRKLLSLEPKAPVQVTLMIWDTSGGDPFSNVVRSYYQGASGALLVCDLTRIDTIASMQRYAHEFRNVNAGVPLVVLLNKVDLINERMVSDDLIAETTTALGAPWFYSSAKTGQGVEPGFHALGELICT